VGTDSPRRPARREGGGALTGAHNYLQRIDALRKVEADAAALNKRLRDCLETWDWRAQQVSGDERKLVAAAAKELRAALAGKG